MRVRQVRAAACTLELSAYCCCQGSAIRLQWVGPGRHVAWSCCMAPGPLQSACLVVVQQCPTAQSLPKPTRSYKPSMHAPLGWRVCAQLPSPPLPAFSACNAITTTNHNNNSCRPSMPLPFRPMPAAGALPSRRPIPQRAARCQAIPALSEHRQPAGMCACVCGASAQSSAMPRAWYARMHRYYQYALLPIPTPISQPLHRCISP